MSAICRAALLPIPSSIGSLKTHQLRHVSTVADTCAAFLAAQGADGNVDAAASDDPAAAAAQVAGAPQELRDEQQQPPEVAPDATQPQPQQEGVGGALDGVAPLPQAGGALPASA